QIDRHAPSVAGVVVFGEERLLVLYFRVGVAAATLTLEANVSFRPMLSIGAEGADIGSASARRSVPFSSAAVPADHLSEIRMLLILSRIGDANQVAALHRAVVLNAGRGRKLAALGEVHRRRMPTRI